MTPSEQRELQIVERGMAGYAELAELEEREYQKFRRSVLHTLLLVVAVAGMGWLAVWVSLR